MQKAPTQATVQKWTDKFCALFSLHINKLIFWCCLLNLPGKNNINHQKTPARKLKKSPFSLMARFLCPSPSVTLTAKKGRRRGKRQHLAQYCSHFLFVQPISCYDHLQPARDWLLRYERTITLFRGVSLSRVNDIKRSMYTIYTFFDFGILWGNCLFHPSGFPELDYNEIMVAQAVFLSCGIGTLGLILILISALGFQKSWASVRWPSTTGEVIESCVTCRSDGDVPLARFRAKITYRYSVRGKEYTSSRIAIQSDLNPSTSRSDNAETLVNQYPNGAQVTVYYHPHDPEYAVLQPGSGMTAYVPLALGGLLFVLSLITFMFAFV